LPSNARIAGEPVAVPELPAGFSAERFFRRERRLHAHNFVIDTAFRVVHEDEALLILDKPSPLAVHPVGVYAELNLHTLLKKDPRWAHTAMRFAHRLDAETSGVIIAAKTPEAARALGIQFMGGEVKKTYLATVFGAPSEPEGEIALPLGHDESSGFQTVRIVDLEKGEHALTRYRTLESGPRYSRLEVTPLTGRTHQIRVHLAAIGHPIVGDKIYIDLGIFQHYVLNGIDAGMIERIGLPRLALHASAIEFTHPVTKKPVRYEAPMPPMLADIVL
jgi:RluA family pseudouridine synthase